MRNRVATKRRRFGRRVSCRGGAAAKHSRYYQTPLAQIQAEAAG